MSPDEFIVIRHAMPELDPQVPPDQWHLGPAGRAAARQLAAILPTHPYLVASEEPKAIETLREAATAPSADVLIDPDLAEVGRPRQWLEPDVHRHLATAFHASLHYPDVYSINMITGTVRGLLP
jgi:broad specificity phosphatase PhoE